MVNCPSCSANNSETSKFCSECGVALKPEFAATVTPGIEAVPSDGSVLSTLSDSSHHGMFLPGTKVANRYRIVSLVGKGGMGEVYRADDLKLGHTVALKFLPKDLADDPQRLGYFHSEVRLTRQISHPNVCRVYDIGDVDGQHFLSMEYIDGEDLKVLLRRIGRLPKDKGVEIAQQLCVGLSAAHDKGVLHRDLKPANIMIDGRGQVRITDFGLAKLADDAVQGEVAGTPAYMAPEQLVRGETTIQSDLYSLGLIFYELFTGEAVHKPDSIPELMRAHEESSLSQPSRLMDAMDPVVERVILRCLEKEPQERPKSAHAIAAALPGGDPLAAALAAGETPSPELVAAAGETESLSLRTGIACLILVLLGLFAYVSLARFTQRGQFEFHSVKPDALEDRVKTNILHPLGYDDRNHSVYGLQDMPQPDHTRRMEFWYRQRSSGYMMPDIMPQNRILTRSTISMSNPSPLEAGMVSVRTDMTGNLIELLAIPDGNSSSKVHRPAKDARLFELAGLSFRDFRAIEEEGERPSNWEPPLYAEDPAVYRHNDESQPQCVVLARNQGRVVYFYNGPLDDDGLLQGRQFAPGHLTPTSKRDIPAAAVALMPIVMTLASVFLALRNVRLARTDRKGSLMFAVALGTIHLLAWFVATQHVPDLTRELSLFGKFLAPIWIGNVLLSWLMYLALEPYVRRYWPQVLISWTRVVHGQFRDRLVGRELLIGCLAGVMFAVIVHGCMPLLSNATHLVNFEAGALLQLMGALLDNLERGIAWGVWYLLLLMLIRSILRDSRLTIAGATLLWMAFGLSEFPWGYIGLGLWALGAALVMTRFGLIAGCTYFFTQQFLEIFPITADLTEWYGSGTLVAVGSISAIALYGFYTSVGGRSFFNSSDANVL
jgi:serine/threonine protein kinase